MASAILSSVKEEVTCPICLELMTEPMSIACGHSFCQACITSSYKSTIGPGRESNCPMCQIPYKFESLRLNRHMANIVQSLRGVKLSSQEQNVHHCAQHGEKLQLFCRDDGKVICWLCERSQQHHGHRICLVEEVAQEYQNKLQAVLEKLKEKEKESEEWKAELQQGKTSWKTQIQGKVQNVQADFTQLRGILDSEEEKVLQKLKKEEEGGLQNLAVSENKLTQQSKCLTQLISDVEHHLKGSTIEILQDVNTIMRRYQLFKMQKPVTFPKIKQKVFPVTGLRGMLQVFEELTDARLYWVHVTVTSNDYRIVISQDQRQIKYMSTPVHSQPSVFSFSHTPSSSSVFGSSFSSFSPQTSGMDLGFSGSLPTFGKKNGPLPGFQAVPVSLSQFPGDNLLCLGVLGMPKITSGKHYWEVDVSKKTSWYLGLSDGRHFRPTPKPDPIAHQVPHPKIGYWIIGMQKKSEYKVFGEDLSTHSPLSLPLSLPVALDRVGVFVDYQAGSVSFYSTTYSAFLIYKFTNCSFPQQVYPYFNPLQCSEPMTLC